MGARSEAQQRENAKRVYSKHHGGIAKMTRQGAIVGVRAGEWAGAVS